MLGNPIIFSRQCGHVSQVGQHIFFVSTRGAKCCQTLQPSVLIELKNVDLFSSWGNKRRYEGLSTKILSSDNSFLYWGQDIPLRLSLVQVVRAKIPEQRRKKSFNNHVEVSELNCKLSI